MKQSYKMKKIVVDLLVTLLGRKSPVRSIIISPRTGSHFHGKAVRRILLKKRRCR